MHVYFLRHGESGYFAPSDAERELTNEGIVAARNAGKFCKKTNLVFSHILVSPLRRAQQTAQLVIEEIEYGTIETLQHLTPESDPRNLFQELKHYSNSSAILLVSHEPFCSHAISQLISGNDHCAVTMKTTSFCCVEITPPVGKGMGRMLWLLSPHILELFH